MTDVAVDPLCIYAGQAATVKFTLTDAADQPVDLTGHGLTFRFGPRPPGAALVEKSIGAGVVVTDAVNGVFEVSLGAGDTTGLEGRLTFQMFDIEPGGDSFVVSTGALDIQPILGPPG